MCNVLKLNTAIQGFAPANFCDCFIKASQQASLAFELQSLPQFYDTIMNHRTPTGLTGLQNLLIEAALLGFLTNSGLLLLLPHTCCFIEYTGAKNQLKPITLGLIS